VPLSPVRSETLVSERTLADAGPRTTGASAAPPESVGVVAANDRTGITTVTAGSTSEAMG